MLSLRRVLKQPDKAEFAKLNSINESCKANPKSYSIIYLQLKRK